MVDNFKYILNRYLHCLSFIFSRSYLDCYKNKDNIYEKFSVIPYDSNIDIENEDNVLIVDSVGCEFS